MSDFYLMTRAAYAKLSTPVAKAALRVGLTPDGVTIIGTAGAVIAALTLYPIGQLWWGSVAVSFFVLADMLDGAMARVRGCPDHNAVMSARVVGNAMPAERPPTTRASASTSSVGAQAARTQAGIDSPIPRISISLRPKRSPSAPR